MKKIKELSWDEKFPEVKKLFRIMKLTTILVLISMVSVFANKTYSQSKALNLNMDRVTVREVLSTIEGQSEFHFMYSAKVIDVNRLVSIRVQDAKIDEALKSLFAGTEVDYTIKERLILLTVPKSDTSISSQQQKSVSGRVTDSSGTSLPGVSVVVKGTTVGMITDIDGNYKLANVPTNATLVFSFVGMETQEIKVGTQKIINISLKDLTVGLEEVVAVGYGTQKKENLTGSVVSVSSDKIALRASTNISNTLGGLVPGLTVVQRTGQPGADAGIMSIRGVGTIRSSEGGVQSATKPLVLVDGIESSMEEVDANDVESLAVLKDASSASIYGVRAANGVILITTKRGADGKPKIKYNMFCGIQRPTNLPNFLGSAEYAELLNKAYQNDKLPAPYTIDDIAKFKSGLDPDKYPNTDWLNELFSESGFQQNHNLSLAGGSKTFQYNISLNYIDRQGLTKNTNFDRYSLRTNIDSQLTDFFKVGMNMAFSHDNVLAPAYGFCLSEATREPPTVPDKYSNGDWGVYLNEHNSVAMVADGGTNKNGIDNVFITLFSDLNIIKNLTLKSVVSLQKANSKQKVFYHYLELYNANHVLATSKRSSLINTSGLDNEVNLQMYLTYKKSLGGGEHNFKGLLGYEQKRQNYEMFSASIKDLPKNNALSEIDAGDPKTKLCSGYSTSYRIRSGFGRLNYDYKGKYLFEANGRYDGTSRFPKNNRFSFFPSFSLGWRLSEEPFFNVGQISNLKLRASWGQLGNQEIGNYPYQNVYTIGNIYTLGTSVVSGIRASNDMANKDISWETSSMTNVGLDIAFLDGRLNFSTEYYIKNTNNILLNLPKSYILGANPPIVNAGSIQNSGFDFALNWANDRKKSFLYNVNFTFSTVKNKITDLKGADSPGRSVGDPVFNIFGYEAEGLFSSQGEINDHAKQPQGAQPGDIKYKDQLTVDSNGDGKPDVADGVINSSDRVSLGSYFPGLNFGLQFNASYESFDFSMTLQGAAKVKGYPSMRFIQPFYNAGKIKRDQMDNWTPDNLDARYPRLSILYPARNWDETTPNSWWVRDASYVKIRNLQVGYTFDFTKNQSFKIKRMRLYVGGDNLFTLTKFYKDLDPEIPYGGGTGYPLIRTFVAGMNIDF